MEWLSWANAAEVFVTGALGGTAAVFGLARFLGSAWLGRMLEKEKAKYGREIEELKAKFAQDLEAYRARIDRAVFVTRAHFEIEIQAYKQMFEALGEVRLAISGTRPMFSVSREGETKEQRMKDLLERLTVLMEAHNKAIQVVEHLSPFYPQDIYSKVDECLRVARGEILDIQTGGEDTFSMGWYEKGQKRLDEFFPAYNAATEAIRQRISTMAVIPR